MKPASLLALGGTAVGAAERVEFATAAPEGAAENERLVASLKRCPDTKPEFFRNLWNRALPEPVCETSFTLRR